MREYNPEEAPVFAGDLLEVAEDAAYGLYGYMTATRDNDDQTAELYRDMMAENRHLDYAVGELLELWDINIMSEAGTQFVDGFIYDEREETLVQDNEWLFDSIYVAFETKNIDEDAQSYYGLGAVCLQDLFQSQLIKKQPYKRFLLEIV